MNLVALDIPDDPAAWPGWLEQRLVGLDLGDFIAGWERMIGGETTAAPSLEAVCGGCWEAILESGLAALSPAQIRQLLRHPRLLLQLQDRVLAEGGDYWSRLPLASDHQRLIDRQWQALQSQIGGKAARPSDNSADTKVDVAKGTAGRSPGPPLRRRFMILGSVAALLLVALTLWVQRPTAPTWGFDKGGLLTADVPADEYLQSLSQAAGAWFNKRPDSAAALEQRLREFRHGCETLAAAPHSQLADLDQQWLVDRCEEVIDEIDAALADVETNPAGFRETQAAIDEVIATFRDELNSRVPAAV